MILEQFTTDYLLSTFQSEPGRIRTCDRQIRSQVLYPLSYGPDWQATKVVLVGRQTNKRGREVVFMGRMKFQKRYIFLLLLAGIVAFGAYANYRLRRFVTIQMNDADFTAAFEATNIEHAELGYVDGPTRKLRYLQVGQDSTKPLTVFIHGAPSAGAWWLDMIRDSSLLERTNMLAIDRPGYGGSGLGNPMTSVEEQADNIAAVIREVRLPDQDVILHGSSYGGTVSARISMDFPEMVDGLLLQSASTAPTEEYMYWLTRPTSHWLLSWLVPDPVHTANFEKLSHQEELEDMADEWHNIRASTIIIHGTKDWLIYPPNAYYSCDRLVNATSLVHHMVPGKEHDLIRTAPGLLKQYLHELIDEVEVR